MKKYKLPVLIGIFSAFMLPVMLNRNTYAAMPSAFSSQDFYDCVEAAFRAEYPEESIASSGLANEQLAKIKNVVCNNHISLDGQRNFSGLELMTSLEVFSVDRHHTFFNNNSQIIDLSNNHELKELTLMHVPIETIDLLNNPKLTKVNLSDSEVSFGDSELSSIDLSNNTELTELNLGYNKLSSIELSNNTKLVALNLYHNNLTSIELTENTSLVELNLSQNKLSSIDLPNNSKLQHINLGNHVYGECGYFDGENSISSIDLSKQRNLVYLDLSANQISSIDVSANSELTDLYLSCNQITSIDVSDNTKLESLYLSGNQIDMLDVTKNTSLMRLFLSRRYDYGHCDDDDDDECVVESRLTLVNGNIPDPTEDGDELVYDLSGMNFLKLSNYGNQDWVYYYLMNSAIYDVYNDCDYADDFDNYLECYEEHYGKYDDETMTFRIANKDEVATAFFFKATCFDRSCPTNTYDTSYRIVLSGLPRDEDDGTDTNETPVAPNTGTLSRNSDDSAAIFPVFGISLGALIALILRIYHKHDNLKLE